MKNKVFLSDVVKRVRNKVDRNDTDLLYYIGGEHFDNGEIVISRKGIIKESTIGPAFHMRFEPGQVLLMSRNPHLRKAGVVDFSGICSNVSYVCETKNEEKLRQKFLPFIFQSDVFWDFAEANKKGSTNFFLNWSDFERFEFFLPSIEEQDKLIEVLWAANNTKEAYKKLFNSTDELVKSKFIEMFGNPVTNNKNWEKISIGEKFEVKTGATPSRKENSYWENGDIPWVKTTELKEYVIKFTEEYITQKGFEKSSVSLLPKDTLLIAMYGQGKTRGMTGKLGVEATTNQACAAILPNKDVNMDFIWYQLMLLYEDLRELGRGGTQPNLNSGLIKSYKLIFPPSELQSQFVNIVKQIDKLKFELEQNINNFEKTIKALMIKNFG